MRVPVAVLGLFLFVLPASSSCRTLGTGHHGPAFDRTTLAVAGGLSLAAVLISSHQTHGAITRALDRNAALDGAIDLGNAYGDGVVLGGAALALTGLGELFEEDAMRGPGGDLIQALGVAWATTWTLKLSVNAERPNGGAYSFPSGHTATAFAAAPVIRRHYGLAWGAAAYTLGALTALGRMEENKHYLQDVLVGAAIGYTAGRLAVSADPFSLGAVPGGVGVRVPLDF